MFDKFTNSKDFISWVVEELTNGNAPEAGKAFEQYTLEWHKEFGDYVSVYDANDIHSIPSHILSKLDAWDLLNKGANSFGIDKICITRYNEIDVHQDKSSLHIDKNLSAKKAEGMMSLRNNPLKNVRHFVVNTTARDLSHYKNVWKDQTPITFGFDVFVPDQGDVEAVERDQLFWQNIKDRAQGKKTVNIYAFKSRGPEQDDYILAGKNYARKQIENTGYAKWHQLGVGALGKSVLDPVLLTELEDLFDEAYTGTPYPVSVDFYHSSKTLPKNGWESVQRRRAKGIYDEVIVVSGTEVIDGEKDNTNSRFEKTTSVSSAVVKIITALENGKSVLLLSLYHHAQQIADIKTQLEKHYPGFRYWYRKRDECDWPCSNVHSSYAPALDDRTDSVITFGSSGTQRLGKDPVNDYGLNNIQIHGPCVHNFTWSQAEDAGLVKPLMLIMPSIKESEVATLFPEFVNKDGRVDWNMRVNGVAVDDEMPTAKLIADLVCFAKALAEYPEIQRVLTFSHFVKTNRLAEVNFPWVAKKVLGKNKIARSVVNLYFQVLNDGAYNSNAIKDHDVAIKKAKSHSRYAIGSSKVFSRGYDDKYSPKHHAAIHWDEKNIVTTAQEIWRVTRKDVDETTNKPVCGDPNAYYILPMIYNDLDETPTWSEERLQTLQGILQFNKNIFDEFQSLIQTPGSKRKRKTQEKGSRFWIPDDFDVEAFGDLVTFVASTSKGDHYNELAIKAHNWLLEKRLELGKITNLTIFSINQEFAAKEEFQPLFKAYNVKKDDFGWIQRFWAGSITLNKNKNVIDTITSNKIEFGIHEKKLKENHDRTVKRLHKRVEEIYPKLFWPDNNYTMAFWDIVEKEFVTENYIFSAVKKDAAKVTQKWIKDKEHYKNQLHKIFEIACEVMPNCNSEQEIWDAIVSKWDETGIIINNDKLVGVIKNLLMYNRYDFMTVEENAKFRQLKKEVTSRSVSIAQKSIDDITRKKMISKRRKTMIKNGSKPHLKLKRPVISKIHGRFDGVGDFRRSVGVSFNDKMKNLPHIYYYEGSPFKGKEPTENVYYMSDYGYSSSFRALFNKALELGCPYAKLATEKYKDRGNQLLFFRREIFGVVPGYEQKTEVKRDWLFEKDSNAVIPTAFLKNKKVLTNT